MKQVSLTSLNRLFSFLSETQKVYLPVDEGDGIAAFEPWAPGKQLSKALNTVRSAKDFFFPQTEDMVHFKVEGKKIDVEDIRKSAEDFVVFGARACDVRSFDVLDNVFLGNPVDTYYKNRREHGTIVSLACTHPTETCFCKTFGIDPAHSSGDVQCWMTGDALYLEAVTEKGTEFLEKAAAGAPAGLLNEADGTTAVDKQVDVIDSIMNRLPLNGLKVPERFRDMTEVFSSPKWAELSESCIGCGACTFVCPTCQCFDIEDFNTGNGVERFRCWDSCMYSDFTQMAAANPRHTQVERFRQRFMHKLCYYPKDYNGMYSCVGCGRCLQKCPNSLNIVKVMNAMGGEA